MRLYHIDAFSDRLFSGNPAAICPLDGWLDDEVLQNIAKENNLSETGFYIKKEDFYEIRWFTPKTEVELCGHATLAASFVLFNYENHLSDSIHFFSPKSGHLYARKEEDWIILDFPSDKLKQVDTTDFFNTCFNIRPKEILKGTVDYVFVFDSQEQIQTIQPDLNQISRVDGDGIIVTALGKDVDFVSRYFAPKIGINEDPVTGSAHTLLIPYWSEKLRKKEFTAKQLSEREGYLKCKFLNNRVEIQGKACLYTKAEIHIT